MKKGCFFFAVIILTLLIGSGLYIYKKYGHELKSYGKEKIVEFAVEDLLKKIDNIRMNEYQDSLKIFVKQHINDINIGEDEETMNKLGKTIEQIKVFIKDDVIDSTEYQILKSMVK